MLGPTDLRKDTLIDIDGTPYKVIDYAQKQMGRGGSIVNTKLKNLVNGNVVNKTFKNDESVSPAQIDRVNVQYLYSQNDTMNFMNTDTFEPVEVLVSVDSNIPKYILEGEKIDALYFDGKVIGFEWPKNVILKVAKTAGADKGNSASASTKEAELETGIKVQVPQFIKIGDKIKVDTRSGQYLERTK